LTARLHRTGETWQASGCDFFIERHCKLCGAPCRGTAHLTIRACACQQLSINNVPRTAKHVETHYLLSAGGSCSDGVSRRAASPRREPLPQPPLPQPPLARIAPTLRAPSEPGTTSQDIQSRQQTRPQACLRDVRGSTCLDPDPHWICSWLQTPLLSSLVPSSHVVQALLHVRNAMLLLHATPALRPTLHAGPTSAASALATLDCCACVTQCSAAATHAVHARCTRAPPTGTSPTSHVQLQLSSLRRTEPGSHASLCGPLRACWCRPTSCGAANYIAAHIAGVQFDSEEVNIRTHVTASGTDFYKINPKGNVPALVLSNGVLLNENGASLQYIADQAPEKQLAPKNGTVERYQLAVLALATGRLLRAGLPLPPSAAGCSSGGLHGDAGTRGREVEERYRQRRKRRGRGRVNERRVGGCSEMDDECNRLVQRSAINRRTRRVAHPRVPSRLRLRLSCFLSPSVPPPSNRRPRVRAFVCVTSAVQREAHGARRSEAAAKTRERHATKGGRRRKGDNSDKQMNCICSSVSGICLVREFGHETPQSAQICMRNELRWFVWAYH
jgi:hypothetical protein